MDGNNTNVGAVSGSMTLTDNATGKSVELPVMEGSIGPKVIDVRKLYAQTGYFTYDPGFMATAACRSSITYIDGDEGVLLYRGYPIEELAAKSDFMEVSYLLLFGELPTAAQREQFVYDITHHTMVHEQISSFFHGFRRDAHPMAIMCGVVGAGDGPHLHPARRPRAERVDCDGAQCRVERRQPVCLYRRRHRLVVGPGAWRRQRGGAEDAGAHRRQIEDPGIHQARQKQERTRDPVWLRPSRLQELRSPRPRPARQLPRSARRARHQGRAAARSGDGAGKDLAQRRLFHQPQAVPERRFLFGHHLEGNGFPDLDVHRIVRDRADGRLGGAVDRDDRGPGHEDRPAAPALHRLAAAPLRAGRPAALTTPAEEM